MKNHNKYRRVLPRVQKGFTLVELLIVIIIIAILAAVTIIAYNGITQKARVAAIESELRQDGTLLSDASTTDGTFPTDISSVGVKATAGTLQYLLGSNSKSYCLQETNGTLLYHISSSEIPTAGTCSPSSYTSSTVAGQSGSASWAYGTGANARFSFLSGAVFDSSGNLYIADANGHCINKITSGFVVSQFAGTCGTSGTLGWPEGMGIDQSGNIYVADETNNCIEKVTPAAVISSFAGTCGASQGTANGTGSAAQFYNPNGAAVDPSGNVYVTDTNNSCIRKITPAQVVTTFAGTCGSIGYTNGTGSAASFQYPTDLVSDSSGNLYVADMDNNCIRKITPAQVVTTFAGACGYGGGHTDGTGTSASFYSPRAITIDSSGNLYTTDSSNNCVRKITAAQVVTTIVGTCGTGTAGTADGVGATIQLTNPWAIAIDTSGNLFIGADNALREVTPSY